MQWPQDRHSDICQRTRVSTSTSTHSGPEEIGPPTSWVPIQNNAHVYEISAMSL